MTQPKEDELLKAYVSAFEKAAILVGELKNEPDSQKRKQKYAKLKTLDSERLKLIEQMYGA